LAGIPSNDDPNGVFGVSGTASLTSFDHPQVHEFSPTITPHPFQL
jgi:hypothetical protein